MVSTKQAAHKHIPFNLKLNQAELELETQAQNQTDPRGKHSYSKRASWSV